MKASSSARRLKTGVGPPRQDETGAATVAYTPCWPPGEALQSFVSRCSVPRTIRKASALQFAALLYLTVPLFLFFFYFTRR